MKKLIPIAFLLVTVLFSGVFAQDTGNSKEVKNVLVKVFELSKAKDYENIAQYIAYTGSDEKRKYKDSYRYANVPERNKIKRIANKIEALLDISDDYTFGDIRSDDDDGAKWYLVEVQFNSGGQAIGQEFAFVKAKDKYLLGKVE